MKKTRWLEIAIIAATIAWACQWWESQKWQGPVEERFISHAGG